MSFLLRTQRVKVIGMTAFAAYHRVCVVCLVMIIFLSGCDALHNRGSYEREMQENRTDHDVMPAGLPDANAGHHVNGAQVAQASTLFCLDLYASLQPQEGNIFFSPCSISSALAMTYAGARGLTRSQMARVMRFPLEQEEFFAAYAVMEKGMHEHAGSANVQLMSANALWVQRGYRIHPTFLDVMKQFYTPALYEIDFALSPENARNRINSWVEDRTQGKIPGLLKPQTVRVDTSLILSNALYFKGLWAAPFNPEQTKEGEFHIRNDERVRIPMMNQQGGFRMIELNGLKILELPYAGEELSMFVLLPEEIDGLVSLERRLDAQTLETWIKQVCTKRASTVHVCLPVFTLRAEYQLATALSKMGMSLAFTSDADFSGMRAEKDIFISDVVHKTFIDINEEGTEAAAATAVIMTKSAARPRVFVADHPFIFMIRENAAGTILFFARMVNPSG
jgi:serpin B